MRNINLNDFLGLRTIDVFGLMYDYKRIISISIKEAHLKSLKNTFIKYGLKYDILDESFDYKGKDTTYLLSKKAKYLKDSKKAYQLKRFDLIGRYLGYPECCVKFYDENFLTGDHCPDDFLRAIYYNSNDFFWLLNNILNFDGRIKGVNLPRNFMPFIEKNGFVSLISHSPCSYNCKQSLKIALLNLKYFLLYCRPVINDLHILKKSILYINDFHFVILDGHSRRNSIKYNRVLVCLGLDRLKSFLLNGDKIEIDNKSLVVLKGKKIIDQANYNKKILLFPFDKSV